VITIKSEKEIEFLREGGKRLAEILCIIKDKTVAGVSTRELDEIAFNLVKEKGDTPAFLNYKPKGVKRPYPATLCVSVNDVIVHGIPNEPELILKEGDIVTLDMGIIHENLITDSAVTVGIGNIDEKGKKLISATEESMYKGIAMARGGNHVGDIGFAIYSFVKPLGFSLADNLSGHGVGYKVHEDPFVPNIGRRGEGPILKPGMVLAIEPMLLEGISRVSFDKDEYTVRTKDGKRAAHFEHSIVITEGESEILTQM